MVFRPSLEELSAMRGDYGYCPVYAELFADVKTPIQTLRSLKASGSKCFLLESVEGGEKWSRYSFIGVDPVLEVIADGEHVTVLRAGQRTECNTGLKTVLRHLLAKYRSASYDGLPPMTGGFVGYFAYDYGSAACGVTMPASPTDTGHDAHLLLFDKIVAYDHFRQKMSVVVNADALNLRESYICACDEICRLVKIIQAPAPAADAPLQLLSEFSLSPDKETFMGWVEKIQEHIREGDVFQAVPSMEQSARARGSLLDCYRVLRTTNPSPYMFYLDNGELEVCGASPETLIKKEGDKLTTFPIAGSAPRGGDEAQDRANEARLKADEKELAEHDMLVDLGRNDLAKVSRFGTVRVEEYKKVMRFSHIMHLTSTVTGLKRDDADALDAAEALLPAGTLSGAPKKRAMEIIASLEKRRRGVYGGAVGYIDCKGNMDVCIGIRAAVKQGDTVRVRSGCGVVADSRPDREYDECVNKAAAVIAALQASCGEE